MLTLAKRLLVWDDAKQSFLKPSEILSSGNNSCEPCAFFQNITTIMRLSMRGNSCQDFAARPLRAPITRGWCRWRHANSYRLVQKGAIAFHSHRCKDHISLLKLLVVCGWGFFCLYSTLALKQTHILLRVRAPYLPVAPQLIQQCEILREIRAVRSSWPVALHLRPPTDRPTDWVTDWGGGWMAGGSGTESHSPHRPADALKRWMDDQFNGSALLLHLLTVDRK